MSRSSLIIKLFSGTANVPLNPPGPTILAPAAGYNGTVGSGYGGSGIPEPTDPTRTTAKVMLRSLNIPRDVITANQAVVYSAHAFNDDRTNDISNVRISVEGNYTDVTERHWWPYTKADGGTDYMYGFGVIIDWDACMAVSTTGTIRVCAEAFAADPSIENRVIKEYFYPVYPGVGGADHEFDIKMTIDPKLSSDTAGVSYRNCKEAMAYAINNSKMRPLLEYTRAYDPGDQTTRYAGLPNGNTASRPTATSWLTIQPAPGIDVMVGDGSIGGTYFGSNFDGIKFRTVPTSTLTIETAMCSTHAGIVFRSGTQSLGAFMLDGVNLTTGSFPASVGGTGSGAEALQWGDMAQTRWAAHAGNANMEVITRNVNAVGMSEKGIGFGILHLNDTLDLVSGSAIENTWGCVQGMKVSRIGGIPTGLRVRRPAFILVPDPSIVNPQWEKKGPTGYPTGTSGLAAEYGLYVYENGVQTHYLPMYGKTSGAGVTMVDDVVASINADWTNWSAISYNADSILNAPHLIDLNTVISAPIGTPENPGPNYPWGGVPKMTVPSDGLQLYTCKDIHSNVIVNSVGGNFENTIYEFLQVSDIAGSAHISLRDDMQDVYLGLSYFQDRSTQYGEPGENAAQPALINSSGSSNKKSHLVIDRISMAGPGNTLLLGPGTAADDFCGVFDSAFDAGVTVHPGTTNMVTVARIINRALALPANATDSVYLTVSVPASDMYEDMLSVEPDMTPKTALELSVGGIAGAKALTETEDNHGWNV